MWLNAFTGFNDGAVEVHLFGYHTVVFVSVRAETKDAFQKELFIPWKVLLMQIMLEHQKTADTTEP